MNSLVPTLRIMDELFLIQFQLLLALLTKSLILIIIILIPETILVEYTWMMITQP